MTIGARPALLSSAIRISCTAFTILLTWQVSPAHADDGTPRVVFERYQDIVANGRTFDEDKAFYSAARQQEILNRMEVRADGSSDALERMKTRYLEITQKEAACAELTLIQENVSDQQAALRYAVNDICNEQVSGTVEMRVEMVLEDGWKIVENVTSFSD